MKHEFLIRRSISNRPVYCVIIMLILNFLLFVAWLVVINIGSFNANYEYHHFPYLVAYAILKVILNILIDITILYTYIKGLNIVSYFWFTTNRNEFEKYGETERMHEILIIITRCSVICILSMSVNIMYFIWYVVYRYLIVSNAAATEVILWNLNVIIIFGLYYLCLAAYCIWFDMVLTWNYVDVVIIKCVVVVKSDKPKY